MSVISRSMAKVVLATAAFAAVHSAFATRRAKSLAERRLGPRLRRATYRAAYNAQAAATSAALVAYVYRQPSREIYHVRGPAAVLMRLGQAAALIGLGASALQAGPGRFLGLTNVWAWIRGKPVPREPEGQGPPPSPDGRFDPGGVFRLCRHPANFFPVPLLWLNPRMTTTLLAFNAAATAYFYLGSVHTDRRLAQLYGPAYERYRQSGVPLWSPWPRPTRQIPTPTNDDARGARPRASTELALSTRQSR